MSNLKLEADILLLHGLVVTMDDRLTVLRDGALAIRGTEIVSVGATDEIGAQFDAAVILDARNQLVMPGLINAHTHSPAVIFRGLTEDMRLEPWLEKSWRFESKFVNAENVRIGALLAQAEMMRSGTTTALDMYWFPEVMARVAQQTGFRMMTGPIWLDIPNAPDGVPMQERTARGREFLQEFRNDPLVTCVVQPHSTYTVSKALLQEAWGLAQEFGVWFNTHCSETTAEVQIVSQNTGATPPRYLDSLGILSDHTVLAHCIHVPQDEIDLFAERGVTVAHCPVSNLKLAAGIAPIVPMQRAGVHVALGTDSAQSSNDLNLWNDLRLAPILQKTIHRDPTLMPASAVVKMATCDAARFIGLGNKTGSLEAGKRADVILLDLDAVNAQPLYDVYAQIVYALGRDNVSTVLIDGKPVVRNRVLQTINASDMLGQVRELAEKISAEAKR